MTEFVRELFQKTPDYRILTQRAIREKYIEFTGALSLNNEQKSLLKEIVQILVVEMISNEEEKLKEKEDEMKSRKTVSTKKKRSLSQKKRLSAQEATKAVLDSDPTFDYEEEEEEESCGWPSNLSPDKKKRKRLAAATTEIGVAREDAGKAKKERYEKEGKSVTKSNKHSNNFQKIRYQSKGQGHGQVEGHDRLKSEKTMMVEKREVAEADVERKKKKKMTPPELQKMKKIDNRQVNIKDETMLKKPGFDDLVKHLEKVARVCGVLPVGRNYKKTFEEFKTSKEKAEKIKTLLRSAGMTGSFSIKNAESLRMKKEVEELSKECIQITSQGRGHRNVYSIYSRHTYDPKPKKVVTPIREKLLNLKGIVDSEESDS